MKRDLLRRYGAFRGMGIGAKRALGWARVEILADEIGLSVTWEHDEYAYHDELEDPRDRKAFEEGRLEILCAYVRADGEILASLGGIWMGSDSQDYRRQVEAELLEESIHELRYAREMGTKPYADCGGAA